MNKFLIPSLMTAAGLHAGFIVEIGPSYRIDQQCKNGHLLDDEHERGNDRFNHLSIWEVDGRIQTDMANPFYIGAEGKYGWVESGGGQIRGLFYDDVDLDYFALKHGEVTGHTYDLTLFAGYRFYSPRLRSALIPVAGYEHHEKDLVHNRAVFLFDDILDDTKYSLRHNFCYRDHLRGPFVGFDFECAYTRRFFAFGGFHWNWYWATSRATLDFKETPTSTLTYADAFKSNDRAMLNGPFGYLGLSYSINCKVYVCLKTEYYYTFLCHGRKYTTLYSETQDVTGPTGQSITSTHFKLRDWNWSSWSIQLLLGYDF